MIRHSPVQREAIWAAALLLIPVAMVAVGEGDLFTIYQVQSQDLPILLCLPLLFLFLAYRSPELALPSRLPTLPVLLAAGMMIVLLVAWGSYRIMGSFPLSPDEHMVLFDMAVFSKGRLAAPMAAEWRDYATALVPAFLLNAHQPTALVSDYLPMNAVLRLLFAQVADPAFFNPALALIGGIALFDIMRRVFGDDHRARWVVLLVYALSSQMLVAAMTTYAMTAHMALNLVWLAAFLRGGKAGHAVAIAIGFMATGLHQIVFHPLFAAPFVLWRLRQKQWRIVALYGGAYLVILGWWAFYPHLASQETGISTSGQSGSLFAKIEFHLSRRDPNTFALMLLNLLRFVAWQNLALLPLMFAALPAARRMNTLAAPLLWGILGLLLVVGLIMPYQGHGWGYRYLHPFLGSFALLAGIGYQRLAARVGPRADAMVLILSAASLFLVLPYLLAKTSAFVVPHVTLEQLIIKQNTNFILLDAERPATVDGSWAASPEDNIHNMPDLDNRPLRLASFYLKPEDVVELCRRGTVSVVTRADMQALGFLRNLPTVSPRFTEMVRLIKNRSCFRPLEPSHQE